MRPITIALALATTLVGTTALAGDTTKSTTPKQAASEGNSVKLKWMDRKFLSEAYDHANEELSIGNLAQRNGSSDQVKKIGDQIATEESKALAKLRDLADKDGLVLPQTLSKSAESTVQWLTKLSGKTFDNAFLAHVRTNDSAALTTFQSEAKSGQFDDLKKYASGEVPTIEGQLDRIKSGVAELQKENANTNKAPAKSPNTSK